ncbi:hypothetical protein ACJJTC_012865 [Scirpophaga incertulas]
MATKREVVRSESEENPVESFFDLLSRCQSERMDEQRATLQTIKDKDNNKENRPKQRIGSGKLQRSASNGKDHLAAAELELIDQIMTAQAHRLDSQRAELGGRPRKVIHGAEVSDVQVETPKHKEQEVVAEDHQNVATEAVIALAATAVQQAIAPKKTAPASQQAIVPKKAAQASEPAIAPKKAASASQQEYGDPAMIEMIERVQAWRYDDQRTELPRPTVGPAAVRPRRTPARKEKIAKQEAKKEANKDKDNKPRK